MGTQAASHMAVVDDTAAELIREGFRPAAPEETISELEEIEIERENLKGVKTRRIGLPGRFIEHGKRGELFSKYNLTPRAICDVIINEVL